MIVVDFRSSFLVFGMLGVLKSILLDFRLYLDYMKELHENKFLFHKYQILNWRFIIKQWESVHKFRSV